jgi:hypothetical protein
MDLKVEGLFVLTSTLPLAEIFAEISSEFMFVSLKILGAILRQSDEFKIIGGGFGINDFVSSGFVAVVDELEDGLSEFVSSASDMITLPAEEFDVEVEALFDSEFGDPDFFFCFLGKISGGEIGCLVSSFVGGGVFGSAPGRGTSFPFRVVLAISGWEEGGTGFPPVRFLMRRLACGSLLLGDCSGAWNCAVRVCPGGSRCGAAQGILTEQL